MLCTLTWHKEGGESSRQNAGQCPIGRARSRRRASVDDGTVGRCGHLTCVVSVTVASGRESWFHESMCNALGSGRCHDDLA